LKQILPVSKITAAAKSVVVNPSTINSVWEMCCTLKQETLLRGAIGVAAPQLGINQQAFWIGDGVDQPYLNPSYVGVGEKVPMVEGCLSVKGTKMLKVPRYEKIVVCYTTLSRVGTDTTVTVVKDEVLEGLTAQAFQHEKDHLDGVSIIDLAVNLSREERRLARKRN
jgi:peptide deformylase